MPRWPWRRAPRASTSIGDPSIAALFGMGDGNFVPHVGEHTAMSLSGVWRSVNLISGAIASLPLRTLATAKDGTRARAGSFLDDPGFGYLSVFEWKQLVMVHLLLHGNAYLQHMYNAAGALSGLNPIHPLAVSVCADADLPGGRKCTVSLANGVTKEFDSSTMTHIQAVSLDGIRGISPLAAARIGLSTALAGDRSANRQFTHGALISGLVTPEGDEDLTEAEAKAVKASIQRAMTGVENAGEVAVINRNLKFTPWSLSSVDAQFLDSRKFQTEEIARWYGIPPHLLALVEKQTSWGTGVAEQNRALRQFTLQPWTDRVEARLSRLIAGSKKVEFDFAAFIAPSPEDEIKLLLDQVNGGLITPNEGRRIRNLPPVKGEENDKLRIPAGMGESAPVAPGGAKEEASPGAAPKEKAA